RCEEVEGLDLLAQRLRQHEAEDLVRRLALRAGLGPDIREPEQLGLERAELAQVGAPLEERSPQHDGVDVVALARGERRECGAEPEADEADPRPSAPAPCLVDRAVYV